jgi:hypothetical protein
MSTMEMGENKTIKDEQLQNISHHYLIIKAYLILSMIEPTWS